MWEGIPICKTADDAESADLWVVHALVQVFDLGADGKDLKKVAEVPDLLKQAERAAGAMPHPPLRFFMLSAELHK